LQTKLFADFDYLTHVCCVIYVT